MTTVGGVDNNKPSGSPQFHDIHDCLKFLSFVNKDTTLNLYRSSGPTERFEK